MIDSNGLMGISCDCQHKASSICIHALLIERYHAQFDEPVLVGEEPAAFLVYNNYKGLLYLFSVATASGSMRHHSHKRTIVTCDLSGKWRCKSYPQFTKVMQLHYSYNSGNSPRVGLGFKHLLFAIT
jgi:hypothetical protein